MEEHKLGLIVRLDVPEELRPFIGHGLASIHELRQVARDAVIARLVLMQATAATKAKYARWIAAGRPDMGGNILSDGVQQ